MFPPALLPPPPQPLENSRQTKHTTIMIPLRTPILPIYVEIFVSSFRRVGLNVALGMNFSKLVGNIT